MNEVEKMYENAGLSNMWVERYNDGYYEHERYYNSYKEMINNMMKANDWTLSEAREIAKRECRKEYPPFTAEKQLNIIKWLLKSYDIDFSQLGQRIDTSLDGINCISGSGSANTFEESLAQAINDLWQDLTEEERKQIKEILE